MQTNAKKDVETNMLKKTIIMKLAIYLTAMVCSYSSVGNVATCAEVFNGASDNQSEAKIVTLWKSISDQISTKTVNQLIQELPLSELNMKNLQGYTALNLAFLYDREEVALELIHKGVDITQKMQFEDYYLNAAINQDLSLAAIALIRRFNQEGHAGLINKLSKDYEVPPIRQALIKGREEIALEIVRSPLFDIQNSQLVKYIWGLSRDMPRVALELVKNIRQQNIVLKNEEDYIAPNAEDKSLSFSRVTQSLFNVSQSVKNLIENSKRHKLLPDTFEAPRETVIGEVIASGNEKAALRFINLPNLSIEDNDLLSIYIRKAVEMDMLDVTDKLLDIMEDRRVLHLADVPDKNGQTAFTLALRDEHPGIALVLLDVPLDMSHRNHEEIEGHLWNYFHYVASANKGAMIKVAEKMIKRMKEDGNVSLLKTLLNQKDNSELRATPIDMAETSDMFDLLQKESK